MDDLYFFMMRLNRNALSPEVKRRYRRSIRVRNEDPLAVSLRDHRWRDFWLCGKDPWRRAQKDDDWESWVEYTIMPDFKEESDEEIQRSIDELEVTVCSPYDCTGKPFSRFIHWNRTPCGIVIVRHMSIDV